MTLVSIICPTYNEELYIVKCIDSMVSQNIDKEGFEVLFVDGGSTDLTVNLIQKFQQKYNFIKLLNNPDKVVPYAMNIGIDKAVGDILIRIDAHSYYPENYVSVLVSNLIKMNADNVDVYDPWVNNELESNWYKHGIIDNPLDKGKRYDAIVVAVSHKQFKAYTKDDYKLLSNGEGVIIDIKNIVNNPTWRL